MKNSTTIWVALTMMTIGLAGCTGGGGGELDMLVTPSEDPVTQAFTFKATGPSFDHYEWDFSDGTPPVEGKEVEHLFGFTDGDIVVHLEAHNEGEEDAAVAIARTVSLGGSRNVNPEGILSASTIWVNVGEPVSFSSAGTTDPNGDPLLFRWSCERKGDLKKVDTSHAPHEDFGGVPFGVDAWAVEDASVAGTGTDHGADLCGAIAHDELRPWSATETAVQGAFTEPGTYIIELFARDPKGTPWIGRANLWVADPARPIPDSTVVVTVDGTFAAGSQGTFQSFWSGGDVTPPIVGEETGPVPVPGAGETTGEEQTFDVVVQQFTADIHSLTGTATLAVSGGTSGGGTTVSYELREEDGTTIGGTKGVGTWDIEKDDIRPNGDGTARELYLVFFMQPAGAQVTIDFDMEYTTDLDPLNWYELP